MKNSARRATAIDRGNLVFIARDYIKASGYPEGFRGYGRPGWNTKTQRTQSGPQRVAKKNSLRSLRRALQPLRLINGSVETRALNYQAQPYDLSAAACCSAACLQAAAREPLVAGF